MAVSIHAAALGLAHGDVISYLMRVTSHRRANSDIVFQDMEAATWQWAARIAVVVAVVAAAGAAAAAAVVVVVVVVAIDSAKSSPPSAAVRRASDK